MVSEPKFLNFGLHEQPRSIFGLGKRKTFSMQAFKGFGPGLLSRIDVRGLISTSNQTFSARRSGRSKIRSGRYVKNLVSTINYDGRDRRG